MTQRDSAAPYGRRYGVDEYGRYVEVNGERQAVEPYPFRGHPLNLVWRLLAWVECSRWRWATRGR